MSAEGQVPVGNVNDGLRMLEVLFLVRAGGRSDGRGGAAGDGLLPARPIVQVADQKGEEHAGIHFADVEPSKATRVARVHLLGGVGAGVGVEGKGGAGLVRVEVEEVGFLYADEVV